MQYAGMTLKDPNHYAVNDFYTPKSRYRSDGLDVDGYGFAATIALSPEVRGLLVTPEENKAVDPFIFENYLRVLAAYVTLQQGGLFLHSAGIVIDHKAYLFLGRSGAGKSTLSRLALEDGYTLLSDDANIILPNREAGFQAGPVPFAGELGQVANHDVESCPVAGLFWLDQSQTVALSSLNPSVQLAKTIACCPVVNVDPFRLNQVLVNIDNLIQDVPLQELHLRRNQPFSEIRQLIEK